MGGHEPLRTQARICDRRNYAETQVRRDVIGGGGNPASSFLATTQEFFGHRRDRNSLMHRFEWLLLPPLSPGLRGRRSSVRKTKRTSRSIAATLLECVPEIHPSPPPRETSIGAGSDAVVAP